MNGLYDSCFKGNDCVCLFLDFFFSFAVGLEASK